MIYLFYLYLCASYAVAVKLIYDEMNQMKKKYWDIMYFSSNEFYCAYIKRVQTIKRKKERTGVSL